MALHELWVNAHEDTLESMSPPMALLTVPFAQFLHFNVWIVSKSKLCRALSQIIPGCYCAWYGRSALYSWIVPTRCYEIMMP